MQKYINNSDNPCTSLVGMHSGAPTVEDSVAATQNDNTELPHDPEIPLVGIRMSKTIRAGRRQTLPTLKPASFTRAEHGSQCPSVGEWVNTTPPARRERDQEILGCAATQTNLKDMILSEINWIEKNEYRRTPFIQVTWESQNHRARKNRVQQGW